MTTVTEKAVLNYRRHSGGGPCFSMASTISRCLRSSRFIEMAMMPCTDGTSQNTGMKKPRSFTALATLGSSDFVSLGPDSLGRLYALTRTGVVDRSEDWGESWITVGALTVSDAVSVRSLGEDLFVLTDAGDVSRSTDLGGTWMTVGTLSQVHMTAMTRDGNSLVATTGEGEVAVSPDGNSTGSSAGLVATAS